MPVNHLLEPGAVVEQAHPHNLPVQVSCGQAVLTRLSLPYSGFQRILGPGLFLREPSATICLSTIRVGRIVVEKCQRQTLLVSVSGGQASSSIILRAAHV